jgi:hypothetical protein
VLDLPRRVHCSIGLGLLIEVADASDVYGALHLLGWSQPTGGQVLRLMGLLDQFTYADIWTF